MRIAYITTLRLPSERAYGHQIAAVCDAMVKLGHDVAVYAPRRKNPVAEDFWSYHHVDRRVRLTYVPVKDFINAGWMPGFLALRLLRLTYLQGLVKVLNPVSADLIYTRDPAILFTLLRLHPRVMIELHTLPRFGRRRFVTLCNRCVRVVCLTSAMRDQLRSWGVEDARMIVEGDAVNVERFATLPGRAEARRTFDVPEDAFVIGYAGSFRTMRLSKGIDQLIEAVADQRLMDRNVFAVIAGGPSKEARKLRNLADRKSIVGRVRIVDQLAASDVPGVYAASDALIYTAPATDHPYFVRDTSPLKIFEYMAARRPVIAADLPPIHDVLDPSIATFYTPGDHTSLASAIDRLLQMSSSDRSAQAARAFGRVQEHTWMKRMQRILAIPSGPRAEGALS